MTFSWAILFFSQSLVMRYRALNNTPYWRYLTKFWNFGCGLLVKRKENCLYIRKCDNIIKIRRRNEILGNNGFFKVTST